VVTVNYEFYDFQSPESALDLVRALQAGERPVPTRGGDLKTFRDTEAELAGFGDRELISRGVTRGGQGAQAPGSGGTI
jgi:hypothetical protein